MILFQKNTSEGGIKLFDWIAQLFGYLLYGIYEIVHNYGIAILIFTIITKLILLPLTIKQQKSLELSKKMQPLLLDLQNRYKDDQQKLAEEYQKLMAENKFNPFGGCLLSFIQIPIILGMLYVVGKPLTNMVKMPQEEIKSKIQTLMPEDYTGSYEDFIKQNRYIELKVIQNEGLLDLDFLGIDLGDVASEKKNDYKLLILPILSIIFTWLSIYVVNGKQPPVEKKENSEEEIPMPNMQMMNFLMPILSGYIAYIVPQGLGLYWFFSSFLQIIIQLAVKKYIDAKNKEES